MNLRLLLVTVLATAVAVHADPIFFKKAPKKVARPAYGYHQEPVHHAPAPQCYPETQYVEVPVTKTVEQVVYVSENVHATFYETNTISTTQTQFRTSVHPYLMYVTETKTSVIPTTRTVQVVETQSIYVTETLQQPLIVQVETDIVALTETQADTVVIVDKQYVTNTQTETMASIISLTETITMTAMRELVSTETSFVTETDIQVQTETIVSPITITEIENSITVETLMQTETRYTTDTTTKTISMIQNRVVTKPFLKNKIVTETKTVCDHSSVRYFKNSPSSKFVNKIDTKTRTVYDHSGPWYSENDLPSKFEFPDFISEFRDSFGTSPLEENTLDLLHWPKWKR